MVLDDDQLERFDSKSHGWSVPETPPAQHGADPPNAVGLTPQSSHPRDAASLKVR
jgi:hypothetical protein